MGLFYQLAMHTINTALGSTRDTTNNSLEGITLRVAMISLSLLLFACCADFLTCGCADLRHNVVHVILCTAIAVGAELVLTNLFGDPGDESAESRHTSDFYVTVFVLATSWVVNRWMEFGKAFKGTPKKKEKGLSTRAMTTEDAVLLSELYARYNAD
jgi:hypothetical protein